MAGVLFYFQNNDIDVFSGRNPIDLDAWRYACKASNIESVRCINETNMSILFDTDVDFKIVNSLESWLDTIIGQTIVLFEPQWSCPADAVSFKQLDHSIIDWYVFGAANGFNIPQLESYELTYCYLPQNGSGALHSIHIASAVLLNRWSALN
jgi:hypothetical protein